VGLLALLLLLAAVGGCGPARGKLSGQVLYKGKPLPGGWVTFRPADPAENTVPAFIDPDGNYEVTLPVGDVTISVDNREWEPISSSGPAALAPPGAKLPAEGLPKGGAAPPKGDREHHPGSYVPIPQKYYSVETSGLRYTVKKGADTYKIELQ
jgi:hypothetical protein